MAAIEYYSGTISFSLPFSVTGFSRFMVSEAVYSIAFRREIPIYKYTIPYELIEDFIATVESGGERKKPRPDRGGDSRGGKRIDGGVNGPIKKVTARRTPSGHSYVINRKVTG